MFPKGNDSVKRKLKGKGKPFQESEPNMLKEETQAIQEK